MVGDIGVVEVEYIGGVESDEAVEYSCLNVGGNQDFGSTSWVVSFVTYNLHFCGYSYHSIFAVLKIARFLREIGSHVLIRVLTWMRSQLRYQNYLMRDLLKLS